jgi:2-polyprenyl-3-methyl-5-hydroxy-6-metoxy-1,4-benzoquinol methylase
MNGPASPAEALYAGRRTQYFAGARKPFVDALPDNPRGRILEIGCGNGDTSAYAKQAGKCGWACGVELCVEPAEAAKTKLDRVLVGNVEQIDFEIAEGSLDAVLMSEVLEHLVDPWAVVRRLFPLLRSGGIVMAGSPNVAHRRVIWGLIRGDWNYEPEGVMDRTHLRWFTPRTYRRMFEEAGFVVDEVGPASAPRLRSRVLNALTFGASSHLFMTQIVLRAHKP